MDHDELITKLGGTQEVADALSVIPSRVSNWRKRGIPWPVRGAVATLAGQKGVDLPKDFLPVVEPAQ